MNNLIKRTVSLFLTLILIAGSLSLGVVASGTGNNTFDDRYLEYSFGLNDSGFAENAGQKRFSLFSLSDKQYSGCYGNQLPDLSEDIYNQLVSVYAENRKSGYTELKLKTPIEFEAVFSGNSLVETEDYQLALETLSASVQSAMDAFLYDYPQVFWFRTARTSFGISFSGISDGDYVGKISKLTFVPEEIYSGASSDISEFDTAVDEAVRTISASLNRNAETHDIAKSIHDYICNRAYYHLTGDITVHTPVPFFIGDKGMVCEGYAKTFKLLCDRFGIECACISGTAKSTATGSAGAHMWNYVKMYDGAWYLVDATWDDQDSRIYDTYFLAGSESDGFYIKIGSERTEETDFSSSGHFDFAYPALSTKKFTPHVHDWNTSFTVDKEASCTVGGSKSIHCFLCPATKNVTEILPLGHSFTNYTYDNNATCVKDGTKTAKCDRCNETKTIVAAGTKLAHSAGKAVNENVVKATCTADGSYDSVVYCTVCKAEMSRTKKTVGKLGHTVVIDKAVNSTCTKTGLTEGKHCSVCKAVLVKQTVVAKKAHTVKNSVVKATTAKDGKIISACTVCGETTKTTVIPKVSAITLSAVKYTYDGKVKTPDVSVKDSKGSVLVKNRNYTLSYAAGRKNTGKYTVTVTLTGNYSGTKTLSFYILPGKTSHIAVSQSTSSIKAAWKAVSGATGYKVYLFKGSKCIKTADTTGTVYTFSSLSSGTDYKIAVKAYKTIDRVKYYASTYTLVTTSTKPGTPTLTVTAGTKKATAKWNKQTGADGYVLYMATSKTGKYTKIAALKGNGSVSFTKTGLTRGKTYYFKVAAYSTVGSANLYGSFSSVKSVKVK